MNYTPKPWEAIAKKKGRVWSAEVRTPSVMDPSGKYAIEGNRLIAVFYGKNTVFNAHLASYSPEMYEALRRLYQAKMCDICLEDDCSSFNEPCSLGPGGTECPCHTEIDKARKAAAEVLAKVENIHQAGETEGGAMSEQENTYCYYCAICAVELKASELLDGCCPYCGTEIPEAVEAQAGETEGGA